MRAGRFCQGLPLACGSKRADWFLGVFFLTLLLGLFGGEFEFPKSIHQLCKLLADLRAESLDVPLNQSHLTIQELISPLAVEATFGVHADGCEIQFRSSHHCSEWSDSIPQRKYRRYGLNHGFNFVVRNDFRFPTVGVFFGCFGRTSMPNPGCSVCETSSARAIYFAKRTSKLYQVAYKSASL